MLNTSKERKLKKHSGAEESNTFIPNIYIKRGVCTWCDTSFFMQDINRIVKIDKIYFADNELLKKLLYLYNQMRV